MVQLKAGSPLRAQTGEADPIIQRTAEEDPVPWYRKPNLRHLYFMLFPTCMGIELTSGFDSQMINALQIVPSWRIFFSDKPNGVMSGELKGIIAAAYSLGAIMSLPFIGMVNDRFGRRWSIFGGSAIMVLGAIVQGFSANAAMYIVARMLLGFGIPTCIVSGSSLIGELAYPKERAVLTSLFNVAYYIGQILAAGICFGTNNLEGNYGWKIPSWLQMFPSLLQMAFIFFIPESPRWLITKNRESEAFQILARYHAEGSHDSGFVRAEFAHMKKTIQLELDNSRRSYADLFATTGMRRRVIVSAAMGVFAQWSGSSLISYYLGDLLDMIGRTDSVFKQQINLSIACWSLVCGAAVALLARRFRRRPMFFVCAGGLLCVYAAWTVAMERAVTARAAGSPDPVANGAVLFFIFAYKPFYAIGHNAITYTYLVEIWPFAQRSRGIAWYQLFSRTAGFFTTFVNPIGLESIGWKYLITYCCILAFELVFIYFMFPETSGRTLEELAFLFEDKSLAEQANLAAERVAEGASTQPALDGQNHHPLRHKRTGESSDA
ncbi:hypothetical protein GGTG_10663 [Gaeumannomyces tritici R3-111a-1]|uniref:Major facilitator superfamily (MFS) profile domain-containing protein n=2 Tax=Gaeumannomyces tritici (strain R3-111a-1) TaxID=644352 RepID=J3PAY8_GAET3|nr:hypothetical protein GGTG_10663 [Gaeumannomyces tritici R3-111a-1]EJT71405.1 hypothetical protein GGTG_10663 [Gaeumannomyces tritici R3-111a-1]